MTQMSERHNQPRLLGYRDKIARWNQAAPVVLPADQGLEAGYRSSGECPDWLIVYAQLSALERLPQLGFEQQPGYRLAMHAALEDSRGAVTFAFRPEHGGMRIPQHIVWLLVLGGTPIDADADTDEDLPVIEIDGTAAGVMQSLGESQRQVRPNVFDEHGELIGA